MLIIAHCTGSLGMNVVVCYVGRTTAAAAGMAACSALCHDWWRRFAAAVTLRRRQRRLVGHGLCTVRRLLSKSSSMGMDDRANELRTKRYYILCSRYVVVL